MSGMEEIAGGGIRMGSQTINQPIKSLSKGHNSTLIWMRGKFGYSLRLLTSLCILLSSFFAKTFLLIFSGQFANCECYSYNV